MKVLVDINHPAHVHFFKNFIWEMEKKGHEVTVVASKKDITYNLLDEYGIGCIKIGGYGKSALTKMITLLLRNLQIFWIALKKQPDVMTGIASFRASHAAWLLRKKSFIFDDTEHSTGEIALYKPFATKVFSPLWFKHDLGSKHVKYKGFHELAYLHPNRFQPDNSILKQLGVLLNEKYSILRFVAWTAIHDIGHAGLTIENKRKAVEEFSKFGKVFITSEKKLPDDLEKYRITIPAGKIHDAVFYAGLVYGESATMTSEAAMLGTPAIFLDNDGRCYTKEQEEVYQAVFNFTESVEYQVIKQRLMIGRLGNTRN